MTATVEIRNLTKRYGPIEAVGDVSFDLQQGETIALVGHNGAGKTTLLKLMLGLPIPPPGLFGCSARIQQLASSPQGAGLVICRKTSPSIRR